MIIEAQLSKKHCKIIRNNAKDVFPWYASIGNLSEEIRQEEEYSAGGQKSWLQEYRKCSKEDNMRDTFDEFLITSDLLVMYTCICGLCHVLSESFLLAFNTEAGDMFIETTVFILIIW